MEEIVNRVESSGLVTIDFDEHLGKGNVIFFDLSDFLFKGLILREKDFRMALKEHGWSAYQNKHVVIGCTADAIVPTWAYMLVCSKMVDFAKDVLYGDKGLVERLEIDLAIKEIMCSGFDDKKVVIKGCGGLENRDYAFTEITKKLVPKVASLMYGEPCSTVPVFKKPRRH